MVSALNRGRSLIFQRSGSKKWRHTTRQLRGLRRLRFAWKQKSDRPGKVLRKRGMELCFDESATSTLMKTQIRVKNKRPVRLEWRWLYFCSVSDFPFCRLSNARWIFASIEVDFVWDADVPYKDFFQVAKRWIVLCYERLEGGKFAGRWSQHGALTDSGYSLTTTNPQPISGSALIATFRWKLPL